MRGGGTKTRSMEEDILFRVFRTYYELRPSLLLPPDIENREFAFQPWGSHSYVRHISFREPKELMEYLVEHVPLHAYYSLARYEIPEARSMEEKGFIGADLMFDIDADHFEGCQENLVSDRCLQEAARAAYRLVRILRRDFGIKSILVYFTGHRGFHIIASSSKYETLGREERLEIAKYVAAEGLELDLILPLRGASEPSRPDPSEPGWRGWIGEFISFKYNNFRELRLKRLLGPHWRDALHHAVRAQAVPIDMQVTQDTSRLVRIPGSLNGKTGLRVEVTSDPLRFRVSKRLSPLRGSAVIRSKVDVEVDSFLGRPLNIKAKREETVDAAIAVVLALKGLADILEVNGFVEVGSRRRPL